MRCDLNKRYLEMMRGVIGVGCECFVDLGEEYRI